MKWRHYFLKSCNSVIVSNIYGGFLTCFLYFHVISVLVYEEQENKQKESIDWVTFLGFYRSTFLPGVSTLEFLEGVYVQKKNILTKADQTSVVHFSVVQL